MLDDQTVEGNDLQPVTGPEPTQKKRPTSDRREARLGPCGRKKRHKKSPAVLPTPGVFCEVKSEKCRKNPGWIQSCVLKVKYGESKNPVKVGKVTHSK